MEKLNTLTSADIVAENIEVLKQLFPTIVTEDKIDINELKALLGDNIEEKQEYYRFTWAGKSQARIEANKPTTATLRPNKKDSKDWDTTNNIFIEGDNLEVLKLLQKSYANQIKMIYIDPPYNTGNDFVYKDNYADNLGNYLNITGQTNEEGKKTSTNTESGGRYHSNWLSMIYPRLRLARNLMTDDGVIFISIDDNEINNLKKICDEVFGEENFISSIIIQSNKRGQTYKEISKTHEYLLAYSKGSVYSIYELEKKDNSLPYSDIDGNYDLWELRNRNPKFGKFNRPNLFYPIFIDPNSLNEEGLSNISLLKDDKYIIEVYPLNSEGAESCWRWDRINVAKNLKDPYKHVVGKQKKDGNWNIYQKSRKSTTKVKSIWDDNEVISEQGTIELGKLGLKNLFDHPKPLNLIKRTLQIGSNIDDIVLDFFAGSATTAHAVMQLNSEDNGSRKCISIQLPEPLDENCETFKAGYATIAEITKERIRRAGDAIIATKKERIKVLQDKVKGKLVIESEKEEIKILEESIAKLDIGFKAFKLDSSNIQAWDGNPDNLEEQLDIFANNIKTDRTEEDILFEILLKYGLDLTVAIEEKIISGQKVFSVGQGTLFICLSNAITPAVSEGIGTWKQELNPTICRVIFKDTGFQSDKDKTNAMQILKRFGIEEVNSI